jgi:hypothetical protein
MAKIIRNEELEDYRDFFDDDDIDDDVIAYADQPSQVAHHRVYHTLTSLLR